MWQQLRIQLESNDCMALEQQLLEAGAISMTYIDAADQPIYIDHPIFQKAPNDSPLWKDTCLLCMFDRGKNLEPLVEKLQQHPVVKKTKDISIEKIEDQEWERCWMADFLPLQFGKKLWVCPSWLTPPDPEATNISLDPGLAFGTGTHISTSLCLRWLEQASLEYTELIDYGCGSGILAIAAALLGVSKVHAVDNDKQAIVATIDNSCRNNIVEGVIKAYLPEALPELQADILVANILAEPLLDLSFKFSELVKPGGKIVLSGLLEDQVVELITCYQKWFDIEEPLIDHEWGLLIGTRRA